MTIQKLKSWLILQSLQTKIIVPYLFFILFNVVQKWRSRLWPYFLRLCFYAAHELSPDCSLITEKKTNTTVAMVSFHDVSSVSHVKTETTCFLFLPLRVMVWVVWGRHTHKPSSVISDLYLYFCCYERNILVIFFCDAKNVQHHDVKWWQLTALFFFYFFLFPRKITFGSVCHGTPIKVRTILISSIYKNVSHSLLTYSNSHRWWLNIF